MEEVVMRASERAVSEGLKRKGFTVLRGGWPDFLAFVRREDGSLVITAVEVKEETGRLSQKQREMRRILGEYGIPVSVVRMINVGDEVICQVEGPVHPRIGQRWKHRVADFLGGGDGPTD